MDDAIKTILHVILHNDKTNKDICFKKEINKIIVFQRDNTVFINGERMHIEECELNIDAMALEVDIERLDVDSTSDVTFYKTYFKERGWVIE